VTVAESVFWNFALMKTFIIEITVEEHFSKLSRLSFACRSACYLSCRLGGGKGANEQRRQK